MHQAHQANACSCQFKEHYSLTHLGVMKAGRRINNDALCMLGRKDVTSVFSQSIESVGCLWVSNPLCVIVAISNFHA